MGQHPTVIAVFILACLAMGGWQVQASDPELTTDFAIPEGVNVSTLNGRFFTSPVLRNVTCTAKEGKFATVTPANVYNFPALEGLGVSSALLQFPPGSVNVPHTHPRGTEVLFLLEGVLDVGLVDTTNRLFTQTLRAGDLFVFPKGLVHFQINWGKHSRTAKALAGFSSSNPGLVRLPNTLFESNISNKVLAKSFGVSASVIKQLKNATVS